jgi:hypothetical protein
MTARLSALLLLSTFFCMAPPAVAQHDGHDAHESHATNTAPVAIPAQRHATDAPLREGMSRIHSALDELARYEEGRMSRSIAVTHVDEIKAAIDSIFANCELAPDADAALHGMLVPLLGGIQAFQKNPAETSTVAAMRRAVADYSRVFDDPTLPPAAGADRDQSH